MPDIQKSERLNKLSYSIRGPVYEKALAMEAAGQKIINLNIGNPAPFGFDVPDEIVSDMIMNIRSAQGYSHALGIFPARKAVMHRSQEFGIENVTIEDIIIGNGVSELIVMCMQALLNEDDEVLVPSPDYPLWTTAVAMAGGKPVHYLCDEANEWNPDLDDIKAKISPRTKALVVINPNNPTGAVYSLDILKGIVKLAEEHKFIVFSDEIYDKILFNENTHIPIATLSKDVFFMTFGGLSKNYRAAGFRGGWVIASGAKHKATSYFEGLTLLASMRLCANVITQYGIQTALGGYQSINDLVAVGGRLHKQVMYVYERLIKIKGVSCIQPKGSLYVFPKIDLAQFNFKDDEEFVYNLLIEQKVLVVSGTGFNFKSPDHFRIVCLATIEELTTAMDRIEAFLDAHRI